jgi:tetratricopeptide (TPR) repeat protein
MKSTSRFVIFALGISFLCVLGCMGDPHFVGGKNYVKQQVWDKAAAELQLAVQDQPENAEAWYYLGWAEGELGNFDKAAAAFKKSKELSSVFAADVDEKVKSFWEDLAARGQDLERGGRHEEAARVFEDAILLRPDHVGSYSYLANLYAQMGDVDKAAEKFEAALELRPDNDTTLTNYAKFLEDSGLHERAIPLFEKLSAQRPDDEVLQHHLAGIYWETGRQEEAIELYKKVKDPTVLMNRAYDSFAADDFTNAARYYELARDIAEPGSAAYFDASYNAIVSTFKLQDFPKAITMGEKLVQEKPDDPQYWRILGNSYARGKMTEKALEAHKRAETLEKGR